MATLERVVDPGELFTSTQASPITKTIYTAAASTIARLNAQLMSTAGRLVNGNGFISSVSVTIEISFDGKRFLTILLQGNSLPASSEFDILDINGDPIALLLYDEATNKIIPNPEAKYVNGGLVLESFVGPNHGAFGAPSLEVQDIPQPIILAAGQSFDVKFTPGSATTSFKGRLVFYGFATVDAA